MSRGKYDSTRFGTQVAATNTSLAWTDVRGKGRFLASASGVNFDLPATGEELYGKEFSLVNETAGWITASSSGSEFIGGGNQICVGPYQAALAEYNRRANYLYHISCTGVKMPKLASSHTMTLAWTTGTPGAGTITQDFQYSYHDGIMFFRGKVLTTDGAGATQLTCSLPKVPYYTATKIPIRASKSIDGTVTDAMGYIAADETTEASRVITFASPGTWTDDKTCWVEFSGWYPVAGFTSYTPSETWTTGTPASITKAGFYKVVDGVVFGVYGTSSADNNAATQLVVLPPDRIHPPDTDTYVAVTGLALSNATYTNPYAYLDSANATEASRAFTLTNPPTWTDGQAVAVYMTYAYELNGGQAFGTKITSSATWTTGTPGSQTVVGRYQVVDNQWCVFSAYITSADSNGATELTFAPPMVPALEDSRVMLDAYVLNNATHVYPSAYLAADETDIDDRLVAFDLFPTCTDATTVTVRVSGIYRVAG
jgi:hypothetical protein